MQQNKSSLQRPRAKRSKGNTGATTEATTKADLTPEQRLHAGRLATSGLLHAAAVMEPLQKNLVGENANADAIYQALDEKLTQIKSGNMATVESMLLSQATSLQTLYASLARKAFVQEYLPQYQAHLMLALKAQAQCRATLEALIELKHPRHGPTFVRQANIAHGPQQVNNGQAQGSNPDASAPARTEDMQDAPNKLLEADHGQRLDSGAQAASVRVDQTVAAMGQVHRPDDA